MVCASFLISFFEKLLEKLTFTCQDLSGGGFVCVCQGEGGWRLSCPTTGPRMTQLYLGYVCQDSASLNTAFLGVLA